MRDVRGMEVFARSRSVVEQIYAERQRQKNAEGWTPEHDDEHDNGSLAVAASCYALHATESDGFRRSFDATTMPEKWPWRAKWWKPKDRRRDLIRVGALIVAEIERLDRRALKGEG